MAKVMKYSGDECGWQRRPGPLRVWRVVECPKKADDGKTSRFSIEELPEDRYEEALNMMLTTFVRDEPLCRTSKVPDDPAAMEDFRKLWSFSLRQGITVAAFLVDESNPKPPLAGVNMTLIDCDATEKALHEIQFEAESTKKILQLLHTLEAEKNPRQIYGVDEYMTALGLCVDPKYRGLGLGIELLNARNEMASAYGIHATTTVFTALAAQKAAARAGFELLVEKNYADVRNDDSSEMFPGIPSKSVKLMGKKFSG